MVKYEFVIAHGHCNVRHTKPFIRTYSAYLRESCLSSTIDCVVCYRLI